MIICIILSKNMLNHKTPVYLVLIEICIKLIKYFGILGEYLMIWIFKSPIVTSTPENMCTIITMFKNFEYLSEVTS